MKSRSSCIFLCYPKYNNKIMILLSYFFASSFTQWNYDSIEDNLFTTIHHNFVVIKNYPPRNCNFIVVFFLKEKKKKHILCILNVFYLLNTATLHLLLIYWQRLHFLNISTDWTPLLSRCIYWTIVFSLTRISIILYIDII